MWSGMVGHRGGVFAGNWAANQFYKRIPWEATSCGQKSRTMFQVSISWQYLRPRINFLSQFSLLVKLQVYLAELFVVKNMFGKHLAHHTREGRRCACWVLAKEFWRKAKRGETAGSPHFLASQPSSGCTVRLGPPTTLAPGPPTFPCGAPPWPPGRATAAGTQIYPGHFSPHRQSLRGRYAAGGPPLSLAQGKGWVPLWGETRKGEELFSV